MPMTKAERAAMDALYERAALSWPAPPPKPIDIETALAASGSKWVRAWWMNPHANAVGQGVTDGHLHARTPYTDEQLASRYSGGSRVALSQTVGGSWYGSKLDALRALHFAKALTCAHDLAAAQRAVEAEEAAPTNGAD